MGALVQLVPGSLFARDFRVVRPLAEGGMGAVYVVEQLSTGKERALKIMHPQFVTDARSRERFTQEARAGARIESDHVIEVVGAGVDDATGTPWLAMELLRGDDLASVVRARGRLAPAEVLEVFRQLCHALAAAHHGGLVHRDLKPENIFLAVSRRQGAAFVVKVLDFGIAKLVQENRTAATATGVMGSPLWMAPEQTSPGQIRAATDVWALGLIAFHLLTGRYYWKTANDANVTLPMLMREMLFEPLEPASARAAALGFAGTIPPGFDGWFARAVVREADQRFRDAGEALSALTAALAPFASVVVTAPAPPVAPPLTATVAAPMPPVASAPVAAWQASSPAAPVQALPAARRSRGLAWIGGAALATTVALGVGLTLALRGTPSERGGATTAPATEDYDYLIAQGESLEATRRFAEAREHFERALALRPGDPRALTGLGWTELGAGRPENAVARFRQAIASDSRDADAHAGLGQALTDLGRHREALDAYNRYLELAPAGEHASTAHQRVAHLMQELGELEADAAPSSAGDAGDGLPERPTDVDVTAAMRAVTPAIHACGDGSGGTARVSFTFLDVGTVSSVTVDEPLARTRVGACIVRAARHARLPPFRAGTLFTLRHPFTLPTRAAQAPTPGPPAGSPLDEARACLRAGDNACAVRALQGRARTEQELALLATTYRAMGQRDNALRTMRRYLQMYPTGARSDEFRRYVDGS